jgi:ankyrin repeat protein
MRKRVIAWILGILVIVMPLAAQTDFFTLCKNGTAPEVSQTLKAGADIAARDTIGVTPLMYAARYNSNPEVITTLLKARADIAARNTDGWTMLGPYVNTQS